MQKKSWFLHNLQKLIFPSHRQNAPPRIFRHGVHNACVQPRLAVKERADEIFQPVEKACFGVMPKQAFDKF